MKYGRILLPGSSLHREYILLMSTSLNKNISEKMSEYVGFSPPPTYFLHTLLGLVGDYCKPTKPSSVCRKYVGGGENPTYSLIFSEMFLFLFMIFFISTCTYMG